MTLDYVLVGGGLANGLIALALLRRWPGVRIAVVEAGERLGGNHTWSFHAADLAPAETALVDRLVEHRWSSYEVAFPGERRTVNRAYASFGSMRFDCEVRSALVVGGARLLTGVEAAAVDAHTVTLTNGEVLRGAVVVDGRGPEEGDASSAGFQKFVGQEVETSGGEPLRCPMVMDATVEQTDGYRFIYALPLGAGRALVEDTYFSDAPALDRPAAREAIRHWAAARGWQLSRVVREESGVLPMPWRGDPPSLRRPVRTGYRGGWFHPATGYSLGIAARVATAFASAEPGPALDDALGALAAAHERQVRFFHLVNRLLFRAIAPRERWRLFARFFRLPLDTQQRFFALATTRRDRLRILVGPPPKGLELRRAFALEETP